MGSRGSKAWLVNLYSICLRGFFLLAMSAQLSAQPQLPGVEPVPESNGSPASVRQAQPEFLVRAEVNHTTGQYREGDSFNVRVVSEVDAYVYVVFQQADGHVFQIFLHS